MNDDSILGSSLKQIGNLGKQTVKDATKLPKDMAKSVLSQAGFERPEKPERKEKITSKVDRSKDTEDFVNGLYGADTPADKPEQIVPTDPNQDQKPGRVKDQQQTQQKAELSPDEQAKLQQLRNKLHQETYYQPLITRPKKQEEVEKPKERIERLETEDLQKKEEEKKKRASEDISLERERTKTEKRPGAG